MTNKFIGKNILILACSRSGHHAIINWLTNQCKGHIKYYNNCEKGWGEGMFKPNKKRVESFGVTSDDSLSLLSILVVEYSPILSKNIIFLTLPLFHSIK